MDFLLQLFSLAIISLRKREPDVSLKLSLCYHLAVNVLCLFLTMLCVGPWSVTVAFPGHTCTHLLFSYLLGVCNVFPAASF